MTGFHYEQSDPERFQQLCQSLIVAEFPNVTCYPVGQRDGGRDALQTYAPGKGAMKSRVFQIKFVREPAKISDLHTWLETTIKKETPKVEDLISKGYEIEEYILITNVPGTAYLESGSIDRSDALLDEHISVPARMWWRDDLDRRCEARPEIVWSYPELLRGVDVLSSLAKQFPIAYDAARYTAVRKFVIEQREEDSKVRFQQIELTNDLLSLFIDVPASVSTKRDPRRHFPLAEAAAAVGERIARTSARKGEMKVSRKHQASLYAEEDQVGAAALLLDDTIADLYKFIVLEGGPGQGKSTLGQFICQMHRMKILDDPDIALVESYYRPASARLPIKVDLREYATWLSGKDPFLTEGDERRPHGTNKSLESFVAALISERAGGMDFGVGDLSAVAQKSSLLIVLDGLDEVADVSLRNKVVQEISSSVRRLKDSAASLQVIVTTRPSALAEVIGFPARLFESWSLSTLTLPLIVQYAEKWTVAEKLNTREKADLKRVLNDKLDQAHMRELARNPMQLTILLSVIRTRGASLPDKRTTLYDLYVDLFFARESGKNEVVQEFRDELIDIHRYLAWVLHAEAEKGRALGKIEASRLLEVLRDYLSSEGRDPELANKLFHGVTQRVVFLVGAVEGQYQFEVQPLREYFAAKFLYEDAPHSSVGNPRPGTIDERFDAIARNTYWQNVTRFYAGCFSKGELPALVDRLQVLCDEGDLALTAYPRALAATLAADWVFSQNPRSLKKVIELVLANDGYRSLIGSHPMSTPRSEDLILPDGCGRLELIDRCFEVLKNNNHSDIRFSVARLAQANSSVDELRDKWLQNLPSNHVDSIRNWLLSGYALGAISTCNPDDLFNAADLDALTNAGLVKVLAMAGRYELIDKDTGLANIFLDQAFNGDISLYAGTIKHELTVLPAIFQGIRYEALINHGESRATIASILNRHFGIRIAKKIAPSQHPAVSDIAQAFMTFTDLPSGAIRDDLQPWRELVTTISAIRPADTWATTRLAIGATHWNRRSSEPIPDVDLIDANADIFLRVQRARRNNGSLKWWHRQLGLASSNDETMQVLQAAIAICGPLTLAKLLTLANEYIVSLDDRSAKKLADLADFSYRQRRPKDLASVVIGKELHPRTFAILVRSLWSRATAIPAFDQYLSHYDGSDEVVLGSLMEMRIFSLTQQGDEITGSAWPRILEAMRRSYDIGLEPQPYTAHVFSRIQASLPIEIARAVATHRNAYPCIAVDVAERSCLRHLAKQTAPLIDVASSKWWPTED
jgi:hypothetical protein